MVGIITDRPGWASFVAFGLVQARRRRATALVGKNSAGLGARDDSIWAIEGVRARESDDSRRGIAQARPRRASKHLDARVW